jgi:hypothetical protein
MAIEKKTRTVQDVKNAIERQFGDEAGVQLSTSDIIRWINDGQREIADTNTTVNMKKATTNVVQGQDLYPLSSDPTFSNIARIASVRVNGIPCAPITFQEAEKYLVNANSSSANGTPNMWYEDANDLRLFPVPDAAIASGLTIYFTTVPATVAALGDALDIPDSYFNALCQYVITQAYEMDENFQAAQYAQAKFDKSLGIRQNDTNVQEQSFPTILIEAEDAWY